MWAGGAAVLAVAVGVSCGRGRVAPVPQPADGELVTVEAKAGQAWLEVGRDAPVVAHVKIEARPLERKARPPANVALVIDTSGSMEGKAIEDARAASLAFLDALAPGDTISVVTFGSKTDLLLPAVAVEDAPLDEVRGKLRGMSARGTTAMAEGLAAGVQQVEQHLRADGVNRVVLLGDGVPNEPGPMRPLAERAALQGISVTTLGLGPDYDEVLLGEVAQVSGGRFHYVDDSARLASFFREETAQMQRVYARSAVLTLTPGPGVHIDDVVGQQYGRNGNSVVMSVGDLALGEKRDVVVRLSAAPRREGGNLELLDATLRFAPATGGGIVEKSAFVGAHATGDHAKAVGSRDKSIDEAAARAEDAAKTLKEIKKQQASDRAAPTPAEAAPVAPREPAEARRRRHDEAMQQLQNHN